MKILVKILTVCFIFTAVQLNSYAIQDNKISNGQVLSLSDCVSVAISNSPKIKQCAYNLKIANSSVGIAKSLFFPTIGAGVGIYQEYNSNKEFERGSNYRELPTVSVYLRQLIWDFGKTTSLIRMEKFFKTVAEYEFMDSICLTLHSVKCSYYKTLEAQGILEIEKNNLLINEKNVARCKKLYEAGKRDKIDYLDALVYLEEAKMRVNHAEDEYHQALADLGNTMYVAQSPEYSVQKVDTFNFSDVYIPQYLTSNEKNIKNVAYKLGVKKEKREDNSKLLEIPFTLDAAYDYANKNSLDLMALNNTVNAINQALIHIKRKYYPELSGGVGYNYLNQKHLSNNGLDLYVDLSTSVNIKQLKHEIEIGHSKVGMAENDVELFKQNLYFRIKKALLYIHTDEKQIPIAKNKIKVALEDFNYVNSKYEQNKATYIEFQHSRQNYNEAKIEYLHTIRHYNTSVADLEIAMHYHVDDLHDKAEHALRYHYKDMFSKLDESMHCNHKDEEEHTK